ncbi:partitioning defective protein 3-like isoform X4 [Clytia hemisphaerica]|uniref:PDZ domain-containing protein n=1 Tax=Clytia hemisphaerica TaxID=252671 RepID=A0A7M5VAN9_9CNID
MKVTVCFDTTKVIVPCGNGELLVSELIKRAVNRYCKASFKDNINDINVQCLQTEEQAILDIDDQVSDVCDDKDTLIAVYDDSNKKTSPNDDVLDEKTHPSDIDNNNIRNAQTRFTTANDSDLTPYIAPTFSDNDSGVAADSYGISSNPTSTHTSFNSSSRPPRGIQRKCQQNKYASFRSSASSNSPTSSPELSRKIQKGPAFSRDLNRKSLSTNHPMLYSWIDQHDPFSNRGYFHDTTSQDVDRAAEDEDETVSQHSSENEIVQMDRRASKTVDVQPYTTTNGKEVGLVVHNVELGSYVDRVGELQTADRITEVNGADITSLSNADAMKLYKNALQDEVIKVKRARSHSFLKDKIQLQNTVTGTDVPDQVIKASKEAPRPVPKLHETLQTRESAIEAPSSATVVNEPTGDDKRYIFTIELIKESDGLGFTVTSKDVLTSKQRTFFIKNILGKGAAIKDGRLKAGDQLIAINNENIQEKSQGDVVKTLRGVKSSVTLQLSRAKDEMTQEEIDSLQNLVSPSLSNKSSTDQTDKTTPNAPKFQATVTVSPPPSEEILTLTIPMSGSGADSLGITVKGKRAGDTNHDDGIYVKSILKGGAASKDGRLLPNDHLMCINETSLINLSNNDAMNILRTSLEGAKQKGTIRIIIGRYSKSSLQASGTSSPNRPASPTSQGTPLKRSSPSVSRKNFSRPESPSLDRGRKTPERFSPRLEMRRKLSTEKKEEREEKARRRSSSGNDKEFDERYLKRGLTPGHFAIGRNKSYFRAVNTQPAVADVDIDDNSDSESRRTVSVSSTEIPIVQRTVPVFLEQENNELRSSGRSSGGRGKRPLPSYEEALIRRNSNSSSHSSTKTDSRSNSFKALPDKYFAISNKPQQPAEKTLSLESNLPEKYFMPAGDELHKQISMRKSLSLDSVNKNPLSPGDGGDLSETEIFRSNTLASQCSLDSILHGSYQFSRDGFGRLSISEKKGRGHLDAKQSQFYNKIKRFRSMEELRPSSSHENIFGDEPGVLKKSGSVDTIISRLDAEEQLQQLQTFRRNDILSASTPWGHPNPNGEVVQRRKIQRNSLLNEFHEYHGRLSPTDSNATLDDKKKKSGFIKGITTLLKKKKPKEGRGAASPEQLESPPRNQSQDERPIEVVPRNKSNKANQQQRPYSVAIDSFQNQPKEKYIGPDQLQKELVQAKIEEMKRNKSGERKKRKSDNEINRIGRSVSPNPNNKDERPAAPPAPHKSGYSTWNPHDAAKMREQSRQFFMRETQQQQQQQQPGGSSQDQPRSSTRSINLQRQSSLPPRTKKESVQEIQRVLPRAPSGPMYKSPESKPRALSKNSNGTPSQHVHFRSSSTPSTSSQTSTPIKGGSAAKHTNSSTPSYPVNSRLRKPEEHEKRYSSITDITRHGGSVKISHKAEI